MNADNPLKTPPDERLRFLVQTVLAESAHLQRTYSAPTPDCSLST
jgi:hypothetical protein